MSQHFQLEGTVGYSFTEEVPLIGTVATMAE